MSLYSGGLFMTLIFFTVMGLFFVTGVLAEKSPTSISTISCIPNSGNIGQYGGLTSNQIGSSNCFTDQNSNNANLTTSSLGVDSVINGILNLLGLNIFGMLINFIKALVFGWILILEIIFAGGPLSVFIFVLGIPLQVLQIYFLVQIAIQIIGAFRGGGQPA